MEPEQAAKLHDEFYTKEQGWDYRDFDNLMESDREAAINAMIKLLPLVTGAAVAQERARCAEICRERGRTVTTAIERVCRLMVTNELNMCSEEIEKGQAGEGE